MRRAEGSQTPYEVYCYNCESTFAVGTKACVHCGARIGAPRGAADPVVEPTTIGDDADDAPVLTLLKRFSGAGLWVFFVAVITLARMCEGG